MCLKSLWNLFVRRAWEVIEMQNREVPESCILNLMVILVEAQNIITQI